MKGPTAKTAKVAKRNQILKSRTEGNPFAMKLHACRIALILVLGCLWSAVFAETDQEEQLFSYMNSERTRENLRRLVWDRDVYRVARDHSKDMAKMRKISHQGSDKSQPHERIRAARIFASRTAENLAGDINIISAHTSLMKSLYHRENILEPEFTHGAVAIYEKEGYLYITELFIQKLIDYPLAEARSVILNYINGYRQKRKLHPLVLSNSLNNVAQSHVDLQTKLNARSPLLILRTLTRQIGSVLVNVYTTNRLSYIPEQLRANFVKENTLLGIGFKRTKGSLCPGGCYAVALIFGEKAKASKEQR